MASILHAWDTPISVHSADWSSDHLSNIFNSYEMLTPEHFVNTYVLIYSKLNSSLSLWIFFYPSSFLSSIIISNNNTTIFSNHSG